MRPTEALYGEGIVLSQALAVAAGQPLYPPLGQPPYAVTAYTPLYYLIVALLSALTGPSLVPGRLLSLAAFALAAFCIALAVRRQTTWAWGMLAAFAFLAQPAATEWIGLHRVDSLALALSLAGLVVGARGRLLPAAALLLLSVMTKQTYLAAPAAIVAWLMLERRWRDAALFFGAFISPLATIVLTLDWTTGGNFLRHIVWANLNPYSASLVLDWIGWATTVAGPLFITGLVGLLVLPRSWLLWKLYFVFTTPNVVALGKDGASFNYWLEPLAAASLLAGGTLALLFATRPRFALAGAAAVFLVIAPSATSAAETVRRGPALAAADRPAVEWAIQAAREAPGDVLSEDLAITALAGKPLAFEYVIFSILWNEGRWREDELVADLDAGRYPRLILLGDDDPLAGDCLCMPPPVWEALRANYRKVDQAGRYVLYEFVGRAGYTARANGAAEEAAEDEYDQ
ncbi:MAG: glycosyltransferase 87 family protein [Chloroflexota bacterium]|nr:glycosyltransferase 87 family protein [Dehalococcoidia bacterium]MDW8253945.1 glycosyltransferase 87 family protein [Chloroflexota bacterium]